MLKKTKQANKQKRHSKTRNLQVILTLANIYMLKRILKNQIFRQCTGRIHRLFLGDEDLANILCS